ncbi:MAG: hypothetical protein M3R54_01910 [Chloroflexota bacterium]|nr:hypothetical protein [Chloroflexota bacterium]
MKIRAFVVTAILVSACNQGPQNVVGPPKSETPTASAGPTAMPVISTRSLTNVGGHAVVSPDCKWIARTPPQPGGKANPPYLPTIELYDADGRLVRTTEVPTPNWSWMPDSSGLFVWMDAPQHPATLGVLDVSGGLLRTTGLFIADQTLTRDGKWIVSEKSEGCCAQVRYPEIFITPRAGGDTRTLVRAGQASGDVLILGIDSLDQLVYRDGLNVFRMPMSGGASQPLGTLTQRFVQGDSSPDGSVILLESFEPAGWSLIVNDRITPWAYSAGTIVEDRQGVRRSMAALWIGPHTLLVRDATGALSSFDALTGLPTPTKAGIESTDLPVAHANGRLLVVRGKLAIVIDLATGRQFDTGLDLGNDIQGVRAGALPTGDFILSTSLVTYRID